MSVNQLVIQGTAQFPPDEGQPAASAPFGFSGTYGSIVDSKLVMTGPGTTAVPFGTAGAPGVKAALIEYESTQGAAVISLNFNGSSDSIELSPGGFIVYANPNPIAGITSLSIVRTADATVRVRLFG